MKVNNIVAAVALIALIGLVTFPVSPMREAWASSTVGTSTEHFRALVYTSSPLTCYSNGYYFAVWMDGTNYVYSSSATGTGSWSAKTTIRVADNPTLSLMAISCPSDNNFYYAYGKYSGSDKNVYFRYGSSSGGVISWTVSEVAIPTTYWEVSASGISISATSATNIWISTSEFDSGGTSNRKTEVFYCSTSCGTAGNWASKDSITNASNPITSMVFALSTTAKAVWLYQVGGSGTIVFRYTTNTGSSWTASSGSSNNYGFLQYGQCVSISDTVYCGLYHTGNFAYFVSYPIGGSITESSVASMASTTFAVTLSTDGASTFVITYTDSSSPTTKTDVKYSTNSGSSWTAETALTAGTIGVTGTIQATYSLQGGAAGFMWEDTSGSTPWNINYVLTAALTVTETLICKLQEAGATSETVSFSGGSVSPTTGTCSSAGATSTLTINPSSTLTITVAADGSNTRYRGNSSWTSGTSYALSVGASSQSNTIYNFYELQNTYAASTNGQGPPTWDASLSEIPTGTVIGAASTNVCTISPSSGTTTNANCSGWADYNLAVTYPSTMSGAGSNIQWKLTGTSSYTDTTGGNTHTVTFYKQLQNTYQASTNGVGPPTWDASLSIIPTGTNLGTASSNICTISPSSGTTTTASCTGYADYNLAVSFPSTASGAAANIQWKDTGTTSFTDTTGGTTHTAVTYYKQLQNTYQATPNSPATWDAILSDATTGTSLGAASSTLCTVSTTNGGGAASCTGYGDYNTAASLASPLSVSSTERWIGSGTSSWTDTTGGNTHNLNYIQQFQLSSLTFQTDAAAALTTAPTSFTLTDAGNTAFTSISNSWVQNGVATITLVKWHSIDITPGSNTLSITSGGAKTLNTIVDAIASPVFQAATDGGTSISGMGWTSSNNTLNFNDAAPAGTRSTVVEYTGLSSMKVSLIYFSGTQVLGSNIADVPASNYVTISGQSFSTHNFEIIFNSNSGGGGGGGGPPPTCYPVCPPPPPPPPNPSAFSISATLPAYNLAAGTSQVQSMIISISNGPSRVVIQSLSFQNPYGSWFVVGTPMPYGVLTSNGTATNLLPITLMLPSSSSGNNTYSFYAILQATDGFNVESVTVPVNINPVGIGIGIPPSGYKCDPTIPGCQLLSGPPLYDAGWNLMLLLIILIHVAILIRQLTKHRKPKTLRAFYRW